MCELPREKAKYWKKAKKPNNVFDNNGL